jgi:hypothetical protein
MTNSGIRPEDVMPATSLVRINYGLPGAQVLGTVSFVTPNVFMTKHADVYVIIKPASFSNGLLPNGQLPPSPVHVCSNVRAAVAWLSSAACAQTGYDQWIIQRYIRDPLVFGTTS